MANEGFKNFVSTSMLAISHGNSVWDMFTGLFGKKSPDAAEMAMGNFGKGWGDEHQMELIHKDLSVEQLTAWNAFIHWNYMNHTGARGIVAQRRLKSLRMFITSWDQKVPIGERKTSVTSGAKDAEAKKIEEVKQIFSVKSNHARDWIQRVAEMIKSESTPEAGYRKVLKYFDLAQLPRMPAPGEKDFIDTLEGWQEKIIGSDPTKGVAEKMQAYAQRIEEQPKGLLYRILSRFSPF